MAKKSMIERDRKRARLITKYAAKREQHTKKLLPQINIIWFGKNKRR